MLTLRHMDFLLDSNFHKLVDFDGLRELVLILSFISWPGRCDINLTVHPSFFNLRLSINVHLNQVDIMVLYP